MNAEVTATALLSRPPGSFLRSNIIPSTLLSTSEIFFSKLLQALIQSSLEIGLS